MKQNSYVLVNVLIVILFLTTFSILRYQHFSAQHQLYRKLQNELLAQTMENFSEDEQPVVHFNTGSVRHTKSQTSIELKSGYKLILMKATS